MSHDIVQLVRRFREHESSYVHPSYKEAELRREFIEPLFEALGWDVDNVAGYAEGYKDVVAEFSIAVGLSTKQPDYSFRVGGLRKFFVEVKRPSIALDLEPDPAFQLRRYGWSAKLGISVLTNFRQLAIYDCRVPPQAGDGPRVARLRVFRYESYEADWNDLTELLSKEAILQGKLDEFAAKAPKHRGALEVDRAFLTQLEGWRAELARDIASNNPGLSDYELGSATQSIIDRIVFLRICEDRGIEPYSQLKQLRTDRDAYNQLVELFRLADAKYNSGLFHFDPEAGRSGSPDRLTPGLKVSDPLVRRMVRKLYYPESPYAFSVIPPQILGQIYEEFLGSHIVVQEPGVVTITTKPNVKKAGGVVYTPSSIVRFINEEAIRPILRVAHPYDVAGRRLPRSNDPLRIVDPACGSGSFLLDAYELLLDFYLNWYIDNEPERRTRGRGPTLRIDQSGSYQLTISERRRILTSHIFGVDIDSAAVEVTKLSLLLKVLEKENEETLGQGQLTVERALPDLENNIVSGNSLVSTDIYREIDELDSGILRDVNPFNWFDAFPTIFAHGGFDVVIGNPPWLMAGYYLPEVALAYLRKRFKSARQKFDLYYVFLEFCQSLLRDSGRLGMIVPNKVFHAGAASTLRALLSTSDRLEAVIDFGISKVFPKITNYSTILVLGPETAQPTLRYEIRDRDNRLIRGPIDIQRSELTSGPWTFLSRNERDLFAALQLRGVPLKQLAKRFATGVQTGADKVYVFRSDDPRLADLERDLLRPFLKGQDVRRWKLDNSKHVILFPYAEEEGAFRLLSETELEQFPACYAYLQEHRQVLANRRWFSKNATELAGNWYGLMYVEELQSYIRPHVLTPALAATSNFTIGHGELFATGTAGVVSIVMGFECNERELWYLTGVLNSSLLCRYVTSQSPAFQGNYRKFSKPFIQEAPIPPIELAQKKGLLGPIAKASEQLSDLTAQLHATRLAPESRRLQDRIGITSLQLDELVLELFGLSLKDLETLRE